MNKFLVPTAIAIAGAILSMVFTSNAAWAEKRVALIVGNSSYQTVPQLPNPSRDATSVAKMFRDAGFDSVDIQLNVGNLEFKRAIRKFETTADQADIAVVYYAGHGLEIGGTNYLIPTDARLASDRDADDEAILLERLVSSADGAKRLRLVILDACRDNPFVTSMRRERKVANRAVASGLGKVEPTSTDTLIAYAAKAGSTADDGDGLHSPFTTAVLKNLTVPGLDVRLAFGRVRDEVLKITSNRQEPFVYGSLGGGNIALVPAPAVSRKRRSATSRLTMNWSRRSAPSAPGRFSSEPIRPDSTPTSRAPRSSRRTINRARVTSISRRCRSRPGRVAMRRRRNRSSGTASRTPPIRHCCNDSSNASRTRRWRSTPNNASMS